MTGAFTTALEKLCERYPDIEVSIATLRAWLPEDSTPHDIELCLTSACLAGNSPAIRAFHRDYGDTIRTAIARHCRDSDEVDELSQRVLIKLLLPKGDSTPGLSGYRGKGKLETWLRVVATRETIDWLRTHRPRRLTDSMLEALESDADSIGTLQGGGERRLLKAALSKVLAQLPPDDKDLLRHHLSGLTAREVAQLTGVHRVTVARNLSRVRNLIRTRVLKELEFLCAEELVPEDTAILCDNISVSVERLLSDPLASPA